MSFKNYRCLETPPSSCRYWLGGYWHTCQRKANHKGEHRSKFTVWEDGDKEPKARKYCDMGSNRYKNWFVLDLPPLPHAKKPSGRGRDK